MFIMPRTSDSFQKYALINITFKAIRALKVKTILGLVILFDL